jgi:exodeoxyribonuclease-3
MKIVSWNVNGLRAAEGKGFLKWLKSTDADVVLLQETRAHPEQLSPEVRSPRGWHVEIAAAERKGYSGVAVYSRKRPDEVVHGMGVPRFDREGRVLMARYGDLCVFSTYFPNAGRTLERLPFKRAFYSTMLKHLGALRQRGLHVVVGGDYNTAHAAIDIARPKENAKASGFTPEERRWLDRWVDAGFVDTFRRLNPDARDRYTWWLQTMDARARNVGWRIDYHFVDDALVPRVRQATIDHHVMGSDHCPVGVEIEG